MKFKPTKREVYIGAGYAAFMILFYFIGITGARFLEFIGIALLTGFYAVGVWFVDRIRGK